MGAYFTRRDRRDLAPGWVDWSMFLQYLHPNMLGTGLVGPRLFDVQLHLVFRPSNALTQGTRSGH